MQIVQASFHQGHPMYKANGRQCVANSVVALLERRVTCPSLWTSSNLNSILSCGDKLYESIVEDKHKYLLIEDIPSNVAVFTEHFHGLLNGETDMPFYSLCDAMKKLFSTHRGGIFTMGKSEPYYSSAIFQYQEKYYFFDSHSRNEVGMLKPDGCACVTVHNSVQNMCDFIKHLAASLNLKGIVPFEIAACVGDSVSMDTSSDSDFSGFEPVSDGEYTCKLFLAEEAIKHDSLSNFSDVSDISDSILHQVDNEVDTYIDDLNDSATFLNRIDSNAFDASFITDSGSPNRENESSKISLNADDEYEGDVDDDLEGDVVDDDFELDVDDDFDDDDYDDYQSDVDIENYQSDFSDVSFESDDYLPLSSLRKKQKLSKTTEIHISSHSKSTPLHPISDNIESSQSAPVVLNIPVRTESLNNTHVNRSRKRKREPKKWKRNVAKERRNEGKSYLSKNGKLRSARVMKKGCGDKCRYKCSHNFAETDRENIFHSFWKLGSIEKQRQFLGCHARQKPKKYKTSNSNRRKSSIYWSLPKSGSNVQVCKTFFLSTVGISDKMITTVHRKLNEIGVCNEDERGKYRHRPNTIPEASIEKVRQHINSFETVESHYCRRDSKMLYLPAGLSLPKMYMLYQQKCSLDGFEPVKMSFYRYVFNNEFNLSFHAPKKDQCDTCQSYENASPEEKENLKSGFDKHIRNKLKAREQKEADKTKVKSQDCTDTVVACIDLEEILLTPHSFQSCLYYKRRLSTFNFTIYDMGTADGHCYVWNESVASRGACEIASCLYQFIKKKSEEGKKNFIFYSDNCAAQNKNRFHVGMLWLCLKRFDLNSITHKYLEKGHTQNEGDSIHASIERASKNISVYTTSQWAAIIRSARPGKPYIVSEMSIADFFDFKGLALNIKNFERNTANDKIYWGLIRVLKLSMSAQNQFRYQCDYDGEIFLCDLFHKSRQTPPSPLAIKLEQLRKNFIPIPRAKYIDLLSLCQKNIIPRVHHAFYILLPHE